MNRPQIRLFLLWACLFAGLSGLGIAREGNIPLHTTPDSSTTPVAFLTPKDPALRSGSAVEENPGWMRIERSGRFTGYVRNRDLGKGGQIRPGVPVYAQMDERAPVLTEISPEDEVDTIWSGDWHEIQLVTTLTLYFQEFSTPTTTRDVPVVDEEEIIPPAQVATEPVREPPPGGEESAAPAPPPVVSDPPEQAQTPPVLQHFEAYLERSRPRFALTRHPFPYQLTAADGSRLAYLDERELILAQPVEDLADNWVRVYGSIYEIRRGRDRVIHALQIRVL